MEFLASLAIKVLIGTSICGTVSVGAVYGYDKTLLGFAKDVKQAGGNGEQQEDKSRTTGEGSSDINQKNEDSPLVAGEAILTDDLKKPEQKLTGVTDGGSSTSSVQPESEESSDPKTKDGTSSNTTETTQTTTGIKEGSTASGTDNSSNTQDENILTSEASTTPQQSQVN